MKNKFERSSDILGGSNLKAAGVVFALVFLMSSLTLFSTVKGAVAQNFVFNSVVVQGNDRIEPETVLNYAAIPIGQSVSGGQLNAAYQRVLGSGLFESVEMLPESALLRIVVSEYPTINRINFEGNKRLKDDDLASIVASKSRRIYSPSQAESDAAAVTDAYRQAGRLAATVNPKIIPRSNNRVDLVFEITEGRVVETERISFVGNRNFSDRRLRRVLESKQAGLFRAIIGSDTFIADRIEFDKQVLRDFYQSRGFVDFQVLDVTSELTRERDGFFITFDVREGQRFKFGNLTASSDLSEVDIDEFIAVNKIKTGDTYNPAAIENTILRMERLALNKSLNFIRVEPRVTRNDADLSLDIDFAVTRGPRIFVERIDIEGNNTTLDRVIRREFQTVEGDPFNPRAIRRAAERIRALGYFETAEVQSREGTASDQIVLDVDVTEAPTGSLSFGASYSTDDGVGLNFGFSERNFLGRGQRVALNFNTTPDARALSGSFYETRVMNRDLAAGLVFGYTETTSNSVASYNTAVFEFSPTVDFPVSESARLALRVGAKSEEISNVSATSSTLIIADAGKVTSTSIGYTYTYDSRNIGLNPSGGFVFQFSQDYNGLGATNQYVKSIASFEGEQRIMREDVALRLGLEAGIVNVVQGKTRITDRFGLSSTQMRGFEPFTVGPTDTTVANADMVGGNQYVAARLETEFPIGLPEEYGITAGVFLDMGSVWSLDNKGGVAIDDTFKLRSAVGFSIFWTTGIGPLRFNFTEALATQTTDRTRGFDLTISSTF